MIRDLNVDQLRVLCDEILDLTARLRKADKELRQLNAEDSPGYKTSSALGDRSSHAGAYLTVDDEYGNKETIPASPVELAALRAHPLTDAHRALCAGADEARFALLTGLAAANYVRPLLAAATRQL